jgi:Domain of unknown function (DUF4412)
MLRAMKVLFRSALITALALSVHGCHRSKGDATGDGGTAATSAAAAAGPLAFLQGFEGEIGIAAKSTSKAKPEAINLALSVKSDKIRLEIPPGIAGAGQPSPKGFVLLNPNEKKLIVVVDEFPPMLQKTAVVVDLNTIGEQFKAMAPHVPGAPAGREKPTKPPPKLTKTGTTDKIAGYTCDNWDITEESRKMATMCIADQSNSWFHLPTIGIPTEYAWALELLDGKHFPMRMIGYEKDGSESGRVEVTKFEKKPVAASLFEIPAGYKITDPQSLMQQMMAGGRRPGAVPAGVPGGPGTALPKKPK